MSRLLSVILLVNKMSAGLAMGGIPVMIAQTASRADDLLFCRHVYPFPDNATDLPGYEDDA